MTAEERTGEVTLHGEPVTLVGPDLRVGDAAPKFTALDTDLEEVSLSDFSGQVVLISAVVSVDTEVCSMQTQRFNRELAELPDEVALLAISADLPFALKRFCGVEGIEQAVPLSDHREMEFGRNYGVLIKEMRLLARAIFVIDQEGNVAYKEVVPEVTDHPDYEAALGAVRQLVTVE
jgi:thiol peroxidase